MNIAVVRQHSIVGVVAAVVASLLLKFGVEVTVDLGMVLINARAGGCCWSFSVMWSDVQWWYVPDTHRWLQYASANPHFI